MAIKSVLLTNTPQAISPSASEVDNKDIAVTVMFFCNLNIIDPLDDTVGRQFINLHVVKNGESSTNTNKIVSQLPIDAGDTFTFSSERLVLSAGDRVYASTTTLNAVSTTISYVVI
jgi:hypothetical protein